ncbi:MAG: hypothetical protein GXP13_02035 [Gammaproteobacteria bacterium]|nr:hypothetical protein [Gammaproteobacteria bacterium]
MFIFKNNSAEHISSANSLLLYICRLILPGLVLAISSNHALGSDLYQYAMYATPDSTKDKCELKGRYSLNNQYPRSIPGKHTGHGCWVTMPKDQYEARFQFCYFSGINLHMIQEGQSSECFIQERDDDYAFIAYIGRNNNPKSQVICYFTCLGKTEK